MVTKPIRRTVHIGGSTQLVLWWESGRIKVTNFVFENDAVLALSEMQKKSGREFVSLIDHDMKVKARPFAGFILYWQPDDAPLFAFVTTSLDVLPSRVSTHGTVSYADRFGT